MSDLLSVATRTWPKEIFVDWRRFSSGLWRVPEGDISAAYSAQTKPKLRVFAHDGQLFTNMGSCFSGPVDAAMNCYPLIPAEEYSGAEPAQYTYEGCEGTYKGQKFKLGPKVMFKATDATVEEWQRLYRAMYAEGGYFARQQNYGLFLSSDWRRNPSANEQEAVSLELASDLITMTKIQMAEHLDGKTIVSAPRSRQLDLAF